MCIHSDHEGIYRGYTFRKVNDSTVLIFAIGDDPDINTAISTTWSFAEAEAIVDHWVIGSVR